MKTPKFLRSAALALTLMLSAASLPTGTLAAETQPLKKPHTEITQEHVTLDETHFEYTGEEIRPNVTVRVEEKLLTLDREYTLEYKDNVEVGTATVIVKGMPQAKPVSYSGKVEIPFYITPNTSDEGQEQLTTIKGTDVLIDGTEFVFTGEAIEPAITVTVNGEVLTAGEDYTLVYENNTQPGTASVTVTGVADKGYTGSVTIQFTIQEASEEPTQPEETQPEETQPEESKPEDTKPEKPKPEKPNPEDTKPEKPEPVEYKITKGNGGVWHKDSGKDLTFRTNAKDQELLKVRIDGKQLNSKYYTVSHKDAVVTLEAQFLQNLDLGKHSITLVFEDGEAEGFFKVTAPMDDSNPKTGDDFALHGWTALAFVSLTGIIGAAFVYRKKLWK